MPPTASADGALSLVVAHEQHTDTARQLVKMLVVRGRVGEVGAMDVGPLVAEMRRDTRTYIRTGKRRVQIQRIGIELGKVRILCRNFSAADQR